MTLEDVRITSFHEYFLAINFEVSWKCMEHLFLFLHCYGLIGFEVSSPKESLALESADLVSPPLFSPDPLEVERIVASPCCCLCSGANHLQSAQELCLGPDSNYGQCPSQEGNSASAVLTCPSSLYGVQPLSPLRWPSGGSGSEDPQTQCANQHPLHLPQ